MVCQVGLTNPNLQPLDPDIKTFRKLNGEGTTEVDTTTGEAF